MKKSLIQRELRSSTTRGTTVLGSRTIPVDTSTPEKKKKTAMSRGEDGIHN